MTKLASDDSQVKPTISEAEFRTAIDIGEEEGVVEERAAEMLHNVFEFGDRRVREVMVQRPKVVFVEKGATLADFLAIYAQSPLSRFPVYEGNQDNVVGLLSIKDVLMGLTKGTVDRQSSISSFVRPAYFTPENKQISQLFAEMRDHNYHMAVVVDEFGAAVGVASLSQLTEEIVGPVGGEQGEMDKEYEIVNDNAFQIDGGMRVEDVNEQMELGLPEGDYETMAGFILHLLSRIPKQGGQLKYKNLKIVITKMQGARIAEVLVTKEVPKDDLGDKAAHIG
jgi:putative hemolysin